MCGRRDWPVPPSHKWGYIFRGTLTAIALICAAHHATRGNVMASGHLDLSTLTYDLGEQAVYFTKYKIRFFFVLQECDHVFIEPKNECLFFLFLFAPSLSGNFYLVDV